MDFNPVWDVIDWLKGIEIAGGITALHLVLAVLGIVVAGGVIKGFLPRKVRKDYMIDVRCNECGWMGQVSKFSKVCTQCKSMAIRLVPAAELKERKSRKRA